MYRKAHNTMLALSATGVLMLVALMAATPALQNAAASQPVTRTVAVGPLLLQLQAPSQQAIEARTRAIEARSQALEERIEASASAADALALAAEFATQTATEQAFLAAFIDAKPAVATIDDASERSQRRHLRRAREALALPYFSFAQGLRRNRS
ncbi:MAG: hypothetical protein ABJA62_09250 [Luteimonas sp.]